VTAPSFQVAEWNRVLDAWGIALQCPLCRTAMDSALCPSCAFEMANHNGILYALPPERVVYFERFIADYEYIRASEGRGSNGDNFYLSLPYQDLSGKSSDQWQIRARSFDHLRDHVLLPNLKDGAKILDLGAGNGWMSFRLALAGYRPCAVDLLTNDNDGLGAAKHYRGALPRLFPRFQAEITHLPFQDGQFEAVVFNASFHYAEDPEAAIREALRCVRTNGLVIICDTPWYTRETSGRQMVEERRAAFLKTYGTASDSIECAEFLTPDRLRFLEQRLSIRWTVHSPSYGLRWAMRPIVAKLRQRREPSRFRIYFTRKTA
jgi:SAM-dependent methyltransferase